MADQPVCGHPLSLHPCHSRGRGSTAPMLHLWGAEAWGILVTAQDHSLREVKWGTDPLSVCTEAL